MNMTFSLAHSLFDYQAQYAMMAGSAQWRASQRKSRPWPSRRWRTDRPGTFARPRSHPTSLERL